MAYKTLTTVFRHDKTDQDTLRAAADLARAWDAHLDVLALGTDRIHPGAYYGGAGSLAVMSGMETAATDAKAAREDAARYLETTDISWHVHGAVTQLGAMSQIVAQHASLADLVVLPQPYGDARTGEDVAITEAALFSSRTPVLVLPDANAVADAPKTIALAWNQSSEALAAIRAALPLLKSATTVSIAIIDPPQHDAEHTDPGSLLAEMLSRHGVPCEVSILAKTMPNISDVLLRHASDINADMIVMGAYGHSRLREAILGGATRNMLEHATLPVFMAH